MPHLPRGIFGNATLHKVIAGPVRISHIEPITFAIVARIFGAGVVFHQGIIATEKHILDVIPFAEIITIGPWGNVGGARGAVAIIAI